jgi:hypothetical protein
MKTAGDGSTEDMIYCPGRCRAGQDKKKAGKTKGASRSSKLTLSKY